MNILLLFIICTIVNVILNTVKSLLTVNGGKLSAAIINAVTFGFYTYIVILTNVETLGTLEKMLITAVCNFIGVYIVKLIEEKARKDKLWKVEASVLKKNENAVIELLDSAKLSYNYIEGIGNYTIFNIFCATQAQSTAVKEILKSYRVKYFVSESKML